MGSTALWVLLAALVACSATLAASETALFSLTPVERRRAGGTVHSLLEHPRSLLVALLLGNLAVNLLFFAFVARLSAGAGRYEDWAWGLGALLVLVLFGETIPKTLALRSRMALAKACAIPLAIIVPLCRPIRRLVDAFMEVVDRMLGEAAHDESGITPESLAQALERSAEQGLLLGVEAEFLSALVELSGVRVRELMTPRVDMVFLDRAEEDRGPAIQRALALKLPWVIVIDQNPDFIVGRVRLRDLLTQGNRPLAELLQPVKFVPEVASALALLHFLREQHLAQAVAVDEWGGTAGLVTVEDIFEHIVGDLRVEGEAPERLVEPLGDGRFRVAGSLSIRDWNDLFGHRVVATEFATVGGFVTALLGRIPRAGDVVRAGQLVFEVREVRRRRIQTVDMRVEPEPGEPAKPGERDRRVSARSGS
jgi:magnesium and cobalt exporter, CNNM family